MSRMTVEIWSDIVCPWCYIGKRRFEAALARFEHRDAVDVRWRSFQLDPHAPRNPDESVTAMLARRKAITLEQAQAMNDQVTQIAAGEGLEYHLDTARFTNTFDAHRLLHFAAARGLGGAAKERLLRAYFTDGIAIVDQEALVAIAAELGLDAEEARRALSGDDYADDVHADIRLAREYGISGVPFFVLDGRYGVSGAQPPEVLLGALEQAWGERRPLVQIGSEADSESAGDDGTPDACSADGCER